MDKLTSAGLYGNGLVAVNSLELVTRYNTCLESLGVTPTALSEFRIDGVGWSPEIAEEHNDPFYLSHGPANPLAVIISPDQFAKPVYVPYFSFQRQLMEKHFKMHSREIADLTSQAGLCVELEHGLSHHRSPADLLLLQDVTVHTSGGGELIEAFKEQRKLVSEFNNRNDAWFAEDLRRSIIESARTHGDLRGRNQLISDWHFAETDYFYSRAFGGMFVLRGLKKWKQVIIHVDADLKGLPKSGEVGVFPLNDPSWMQLLIDEDLLQIDMTRPSGYIEDIHRISECFLADAACTRDPALKFASLTSGQRKGLIKKLANELAPAVFDLEHVKLKLDRATTPDAKAFPEEVKRLLSQPASGLAPEKRRLMWQMLTRYQPTDVWRLYRHNKHYFYEQYATWTESKQRWAISMIRNNLEQRASD